MSTEPQSPIDPAIDDTWQAGKVAFITAAITGHIPTAKEAQTYLGAVATEAAGLVARNTPAVLDDPDQQFTVMAEILTSYARMIDAIAARIASAARLPASKH